MSELQVALSQCWNTALDDTEIRLPKLNKPFVQFLIPLDIPTEILLGSLQPGQQNNIKGSMVPGIVGRGLSPPLDPLFSSPGGFFCLDLQILIVIPVAVFKLC